MLSHCHFLLIVVTYLIPQPLHMTYFPFYVIHVHLRFILFSFQTSELKKLQGNQSAGNGPGAGGLGAGGGGVRGRGRRSPYQSFSPQPLVIGLNESGSLKRSGNFMSHSVRFWNGVDPDNPQHSGISKGTVSFVNCWSS